MCRRPRAKKPTPHAGDENNARREFRLQIMKITAYIVVALERKGPNHCKEGHQVFTSHLLHRRQLSHGSLDGSPLFFFFF